MKIPDRMLGAMLLGPERIEVQDVPVLRPGPGELLLRVEAATTCGTDVKVFRRGGHPRMLKVPTLFGHEMAGRVAEAGAGLHRFSPGDPVVVANSAPCGICGFCRDSRENLCDDLQYLNGAFAEYLLVPRRFVERNTHPLPNDLSFAKASLTEPLACVLHGLEACELESREGQVLVYGAGPIGLLFVAALARRGFEVLAADPNPPRLAVARAMGATETLQIERGGGQASTVVARTRGGLGAAIVVEATGVPEVWSDALASVRPGGLVNLFGGCAPGTSVPLDTHQLHYSEITVKGVYHHRPENVRAALAHLAEPDFRADLLLSATRPIEELEAALRSMMAKDALKVVICGRHRSE